jgi:ribosomal protein L22
MKSIKTYDSLIDNKTLSDAREIIKQLKNKIMKTTNELMKYKPYSIGRYTKEGYADIIFESEGFMTVPKNSAQSIVDLLNQAFNNGVKMTIKSANMQTGSITPSEPIIKSKPMPQEEPHPLNTYKRSR